MLKQNDEGVSPVIGVILMVAITVVLAAVVYVMVNQLAERSATELITIGIQESEPGNFTVISAPEDLMYEDLTISGCTQHKTTGLVLAGDIITNCTGKLVIVYENQVIYMDE